MKTIFVYLITAFFCCPCLAQQNEVFVITGFPVNNLVTFDTNTDETETNGSVSPHLN